ncbi:MAG: SRPBCC family protein [Telluria sp.]
MSEVHHRPYVEPVRKATRVKASAAHAFDVFTSGMSRWWIRTMSINPSHAEIEKVMMEPCHGGRWFEIGIDGSECDWGRVLVWEPPRRIVLAWQIDASFKNNPQFHTEIEVNFVQQDGDFTLVTLEHRKLENYGDAATQLQDALGGGWGKLLDRFAEEATASTDMQNR